MFQNYLKIAFRSLLRQKGYSAINIIGLALGISVCALIALYVVDELSYDRFHANANRIYRVDGDVDLMGEHYHIATTPPQMGPTLKADFPEVEAYTRLRLFGAWNFINEEKIGAAAFREEKVAMADSTFFSVFTAHIVGGDGVHALSQPKTIILTEEIARKYFGNANPIGKRLKADNEKYYTVGAVMKRFPSNSHFQFDILMSMSSFTERGDWSNNSTHNYLLLKEGANPAFVDAKMPAFLVKYLAPTLEKMYKTSYAEFLSKGNRFRYFLFPITSIHLHSGGKIGEIMPSGTIMYVLIFSGVAVFVLLLGCINFMNLATARAANRAKEVGIRKTLGSGQMQLVGQFMAESSLMVLCAVLLGICCIELILPAFNALSGKEFSRSALFSIDFVVGTGLLFVVVSFLAGAYPAFVLSRFQPVKVLKGDRSSGSRNSQLRSTLVVVQFSVSMVLVIGTLIVLQQLQFIQHKNLGFSREQVLMLQDPSEGAASSLPRMKQELLKLSTIRSVSIGGFVPVGGSRNISFIRVGVNQASINLEQWPVDADYIPTFGITMAQGRNFSATLQSDSSSVIINESAAYRYFGTENPLGKVFYSGDGNTQRSYTVIGVMHDFHFSSLRETIQPVALFCQRVDGTVSIRFNGADASSVLAQVESTWKRLAPGKPFEYKFMDDSFREIYKSEQRIGTILGVFTALAIAIACLGLFGLAAFTAEQRTKEIGIRKVLGASVASIITLLSKDFLKLVGIAIVLATPLAYWGMGKWLQDFAYRVELSWWVFASAGAAAVVIAFMTVAAQAWRAAQANPVKSLRSE
jgi:putative ABC transport system permease protein